MRDLKHLTKKRRAYLPALLGRHRQQSLNSYKSQIEPLPRKRRLRFILPALAIVLAIYPIFNLLVADRHAISSVNQASTTTGVIPEQLDTWLSFQLASQYLPLSHTVGQQLVSILPGGGSITYAINKELQQEIEQFMASRDVPYGAFVAIEPKSGRVLAMTAHSSLNPEWMRRACYELYPMASLFKIITAAAALEAKKVTPDTVMAFRGRLTSENPRYWTVGRHRGNMQMELDEAMGKSVNPVFGRLACEVVGRDSLWACAERFGFNQLLFPGTPVVPSRATLPQNDQELQLMGAGLGREVKISPFHAAAMMAAVANGGVLMSPILSAQVVNPAGKLVYTGQPQPLRRLVSTETAEQLDQMLSTTVTTGTSRRAFHDRRGRPKLASLSIAAKTGSIDGDNPAGHYSWFAAYAPIKDPQVAMVALVVNQGKWKVKASHVGEMALETFFR